MSSVLLMCLLSVIRALIVSPIPSCPASCVVCSDRAIICHRLAHIIDAPDTTQALLLTEGSISKVQALSLSDLSNITVIGLSHNHISVLDDQSFRRLTFLHTLLLDHNLLTSQALQEGALTNLTQLEVLALGHNLISMIEGGWFRGSKALRSLKLEGNLLTSIETGSFPVNDLTDLESLDLSDNLIQHLDINSFDGLVSLHTLDLSRNRLRSAPVEAFSYLSWLTNLNLDLNTWNCSCQLLELAAFLSSFMQQPDKELYNGRRMVCVNADNPAVSTVLELTEANCVPSNQNITVQIETRGGVTPQLYARDLAITAVICFMGGVGLTLLVVLICYQVHRRRKRREAKRQKVDEERSSTVAHHHVNHLDAHDKRRDRDSGKQWEREDMMLDLRSDGYGVQFKSREEENSAHFRCPDCKEQRGLDLMRWNNRMEGEMQPDEEREKMRVKGMKEEERQFGNHQGVFRRDGPNRILSHSNTNSSSHPRKETVSQRAETGDTAGRRGRLNETLHCESCHRSYRQPEHNMRQGRNHTNTRDPALSNGFHSQYRQTDRSRNLNHNHFEIMKNPDSRREARNVTFDLERSRTAAQRSSHEKDKREEGEESLRDEERGRVRRHKAKVQSNRKLKVKLNLNPLRKSKVHPKRKSELSNTEKSRPKKTREEREGEDRDGKTKKIKKSSKVKGSREEGEETKEEEEEEGKKSKMSTKQKRDPSKPGQGGNESTEVKQGESSHLKNSPPGNTTNTGGQPASSTSMGQGLSLQGGGVQYQGAGLVLGGAPHPFSQTTNLSLLAPAGSQLSGSNLSLQGGHFLLDTTAPRTSALFPSSSPSMALSGPSMIPGGAPGGFIRPAGAGLISPAASLHANPLQPGALHTFPPQTSQPAGLASSLAANPPMQSLQGNLLPVSSPLIARLSDPAQDPSLQSSEVHHLPLQSQASQCKESHTPQTQVPLSAEGLSGSTPQAPGPETTVEDLSHSQTETVQVPAGPTAEGLSLHEGPAAGASGGSIQEGDVSSSGDAVTAGALLQQEYVSEEGGSSPRRKLRLVLPEKTSSRPPTALERKIR